MIQNNYPPSFCGIPVRTTNIIKITNRTSSIVPATIEEISRNCPEDAGKIKEIITTWSQKRAKLLLRSFNFSFFKPTKNLSTFWIKAPNGEIVSILQTTNPKTAYNKKIFEIDYLISKAFCDSDHTKYKGAGKAGVFHAIQTAKEHRFKTIRLFSSEGATKFYEKLGFSKNTTDSRFTFSNCLELSDLDTFTLNQNF